MEENKDTIKTVGSAVAGIGVSTVVSNIVKHTMPPAAGALVSLLSGIGSFVFTGLASDAATAWVEDRVDKVTTWLNSKKQPEEEKVS